MKIARLLCVLFTFSLAYDVHCGSDIDTIMDQLISWTRRRNINKSQTKRSIVQLFTHVLSLKQDLKDISDTLKGESVEEIIRSQVISETRHLARVNQQMRRQLQQVQTSLGRVQADNQMYREALQKASNKGADSATKPTSTVSLTTAVGTTTPTTRLTTSEPQPERSRILIAPMWSTSYHQFRQLNIHSNSIDIYSYLNLKNVESVIYISKLNSLLIGLYSPDKIVSTTLYSTTVRTVRHNIRTYGMAADEKIGVVFLTTDRPSQTISRMSLQGKNFTALVNLHGYGSSPRSIAVYRERKVIYACNYGKLFTVRYDGTGLTTLNTGIYIDAVTLDINHGLLYYGKEEKLMKMSLSTNTSSVVSKFSFYIWNIIYYRDTVYYISRNKSPGILGAVDVGQNIVSRTLQTVKVSSVSIFAICLIP